MIVRHQTVAIIMSASSLPNFPSLALTKTRKLTKSKAKNCSGKFMQNTRDAVDSVLWLGEPTDRLTRDIDRYWVGGMDGAHPFTSHYIFPPDPSPGVPDTRYRSTVRKTSTSALEVKHAKIPTDLAC